jgi:polar amino acid transport system permease protein
LVYLNDPAKLQKLLALLSEGSITTLAIFGWTLLCALPLGLLVALGRMSRVKPVAKLMSVYILIMRGTPLMLQLITIYFLLPDLLGGQIDRFPATIVAFSLNYAAYFAEIYRGGILAIPAGQAEAAKVLGFTRCQTFLRIVLPQAVKRILQPVSNEVITLVKDTALATVIAVGELFRAAKNEASRTASIEPLFIAGVFYLAMNALVSLFFQWSEKRLDYYR